MAVERTLKERKYDRQIRLWGKHGQELIENMKICVVGSGAAASETLKNLVLPNVGDFTIVDTAKVTARDCGNNFFVTQEDIGKKRAEVVCAWMQEMNPDVEGTAVTDKELSALTSAEGLKFFDDFGLVIACQMYGKLHEALAAYCFGREIPYMNVRINGQLATVRIALRELRIMESHPTNDRTDFFIHHKQLELFPELKEFLFAFDVHTDDILKKPHIPCLALIVQHSEAWKATHGGNVPESFKEKEEFKDELRTHFGDYENVDDAIHWAFQSYLPPRIDHDVREVIEDAAGETISDKSPDFWVLVRALRDFMENEGGGFLPVSTNIPDITCDTDSYVELKNLYKTRAAKDLAAISAYVGKRLESVSREASAIAQGKIELFVKNSRALKVVRMRSVAEELTAPDMEHIGEVYMSAMLEAMEEESKADDDGGDDAAPAMLKPFTPSMINWYWAHRMADVFYDAESRLPGVGSADVIEADAAKLVALQKKVFADMDLEQEVVGPVLAELARFGGCEMHNQAAFIGGVAAAAAMKLIVRQFYPLNHTFVHNGIYCQSKVFAV